MKTTSTKYYAVANCNGPISFWLGDTEAEMLSNWQDSISQVGMVTESTIISPLQQVIDDAPTEMEDELGFVAEGMDRSEFADLIQEDFGAERICRLNSEWTVWKVEIGDSDSESSDEK